MSAVILLEDFNPDNGVYIYKSNKLEIQARFR